MPDTASLVTACPFCDRALSAHGAEDDPTYYCPDCGRVDEPVERPTKHPGGTMVNEHLTAALRADPEDYP